MTPKQVENVILGALAGLRIELQELVGYRQREYAHVLSEGDDQMRKAYEMISGFIPFSQHINRFFEEKTQAKDVISAINVLLGEAGQEPVNEVPIRVIFEAAEVLRINKSDPLFSARLVHTANGIQKEIYVPAEKVKRKLIEQLREDFEEKIEKIEAKSSLENLSIKQLIELREKLSKG
ncbi:MAG TPA: hypothetical protein PLP64_10785 [Pseudothermotoga sp.]|nr:hypothetical protein [Pseudothermotoga sp.]HPP71217.1 hypothetical protein [Pseudothermotoga sp.]